MAALRVLGPSSAWFFNCSGKYVSSFFFARFGLITLRRRWGRSRGVFFWCILRTGKVGWNVQGGFYCTLQASKKRGVTSRYGPVGCRTLPVRALCRPDGRQTYVGRDEWSQDEPISHALGHLASGIIILVGNG